MPEHCPKGRCVIKTKAGYAEADNQPHGTRKHVTLQKNDATAKDGHMHVEEVHEICQHDDEVDGTPMTEINEAAIDAQRMKKMCNNADSAKMLKK